MANVLFAARTAVSTSLNVVTCAAVAVNAGVTAIAELANVASDHATEFRKQQQHVIAKMSEDRLIAGEQDARAVLTDRMLVIQRRLNADPEFAAMYATVGKELTALRSLKAV